MANPSRSEQMAAAPNEPVEADEVHAFSFDGVTRVWSLPKEASSLDKVVARVRQTSTPQPYAGPGAYTFWLPGAIADPYLPPYKESDPATTYGGYTTSSTQEVRDDGPGTALTVTWPDADPAPATYPDEGDSLVVDFLARGPIPLAELTEDKLAVSLEPCDLSKVEAGDAAVQYRTKVRSLIKK